MSYELMQCLFSLFSYSMNAGQLMNTGKSGFMIMSINTLTNHFCCSYQINYIQCVNPVPCLAGPCMLFGCLTLFCTVVLEHQSCNNNTLVIVMKQNMCLIAPANFVPEPEKPNMQLYEMKRLAKFKLSITSTLNELYPIFKYQNNQS